MRTRNQPRRNPRRNARARARAAAVATLLLLGACARPGGPLFEPDADPLVWPRPPERARIEYLGAIATDQDLRPGRSVGQSVGRALFGRKPARSMLTPYALSTDTRGRLFVTDSNAQVLHAFDTERRRYDAWTPGDPDARFAQPIGVAVDADDRILVTDSVGGALHVFAPNGDYSGEIGRDHLRRPTGIAVERATGRIFVADTGLHQIVVLDPSGDLLETIGRRGVEPGAFNFPTAVALDRDGRLYVSDSLNSRIQLFDPQRSPIGQIGRRGGLPGYFSQPKGVAVDSQGHVYVVDAHFESVQIFDRDGTLLLAFGQEGTGPGEFWLPAGIHIDDQDRIWVADSYNRRVQVFRFLHEVPQ